ncbi:LamG domain-containing protein [Tellurirhabdus rosea]|uniref:LamG domain-containing protein n=1 Tax=Tellurirhabdus rosea TaxID=2674997 RepID=UPI00225BC9F8|nr:LamG domain-containing protein [Tellurirhabdus rosea]
MFFTKKSILPLCLFLSAALCLLSSCEPNDVTLEETSPTTYLEKPSVNPSGVISTRQLGLKFDGVDDYIEIPKTLFSGQPTAELTIECWVKTNDHNQEVGPIFNKYAYWSEAKIEYRRGSLNFFYAWPQPPNYPASLLTGQLPDGSWTHIAVTLKNNLCKVYRDGKLAGSTSAAYPISWQTAPGECTLAAGEWGRTIYYFKGIISKFRVSRISRYNADFTPKNDFVTDTNTELLYRFTDTRSQTIKDHSRNANHGIIHGNPTWVQE